MHKVLLQKNTTCATTQHDINIELKHDLLVGPEATVIQSVSAPVVEALNYMEATACRVDLRAQLQKSPLTDGPTTASY